MIRLCCRCGRPVGSDGFIDSDISDDGYDQDWSECSRCMGKPDTRERLVDDDRPKKKRSQRRDPW